jgi:uncharacterized tellurite resistance protein B-like protein
MTEAQVNARLSSILHHVFADGVLDAAEREEMRALFREAKLTVPEVRATFAAFLRDEMHVALADGTVTDAEREKLRSIVRELKLPDALVPPELSRLL